MQVLSKHKAVLRKGVMFLLCLIWLLLWLAIAINSLSPVGEGLAVTVFRGLACLAVAVHLLQMLVFKHDLQVLDNPWRGRFFVLLFGFFYLMEAKKPPSPTEPLLK